MCDGISRSSANDIIESGIALAREHGHLPLTFCVLDQRGSVVSAQSEDGSSLLRFDIALGKAWSCLALGHSTRFMEKVMAENRPHFLDSLAATAGGKFVPALGGVLIHSASGDLVGALGVTGDSGENDEMIAVAAIRECGFLAILD